MDVIKLIKRLTNEVEKESAYIVKYGGSKDDVSWQNEDGVLISVSEAEFILEVLKKVKDGK
jgi:hypothetical protein